jgi:hypothetical protein
MVTTSTPRVVSQLRFVYPFQSANALWEVGESLGDNRWACRIVNGTFMGQVYTSIYQGQEAAFDEDHILACTAMDNISVRVTARFGRMRPTGSQNVEESAAVDRSLPGT